MSDPPSLLPPELREKIPPLYATEKLTDPIVHAKIFAPGTIWSWFITEFDPVENTCFGLVVGPVTELGYFNLAELESVRGPYGVRVERDEHFRAKPLREVRAYLERDGQGFWVHDAPLPHREENGTTSTRRIPSPFEQPAIRLVETWLRVAGDGVRGFEVINRDRVAATVLRELFGQSDRERFAALLLNAKCRITHAHIVSTGTVDAAPVHPREVFKAAVLANAASVIIGHNHPSGDIRPSSEDRDVEERLTRAGKLLGIPVLDSIIVGPVDEFYASRSGGVHPI